MTDATGVGGRGGLRGRVKAPSEPPPAAPDARRAPLHERSLKLGLYVATISGALLLSGLLVMVAGGSPTAVVTAMVEGSVGSKSAMAFTINESVPLMIVAFGSVVSFRAGLVNIGLEGQLVLGGLFGTALALAIRGPGPLAILVVLIGAAVGGALWAGVAALMKYSRGVDVVISTLLMNFVAYQVLSFAVNRRWLLQQSGEGGFQPPQSDAIPATTQLPSFWRLLGIDFHLGVVIAIGLGALLAIALARSRWGFQVRMLGLNSTTAHSVGVSTALIGGGALLISGACAGLAGGVMLTGTVFRIQAGFTNRVGWDGLMVALLARRQPAAVIPVAILFGALRAGGGFLAATGVARYLVDAVQALLVLAAVLPPVVFLIREQRRLQQAQTSRT